MLKFKIYFMLTMGWLFSKVGLISKNDYENFKFNLPFIVACRKNEK